MLVLGIETSTDQVGCAIGGHEGVLGLVQSSRGRRHAELLAPSIEFVADQAGVSLADLGAIAVGTGPGLFTGLRVGVASAKALAHALSVPMIGIPSLDLLAFPVRFTPRLVVAAIDARRGEVFYACYRQVPGGIQRLGDHRVGSPEDLVSELQAGGEEVLVVGDGAHRYREHLEGLARVEVVDHGLGHPSAASLVQLAHARALREDFESPAEVEPLYLRKPDAEAGWSTRAGSGPQR